MNPETFNLTDAEASLAATPAMLSAWLTPLPDAWVRSNEGADTWSVFDVIGHLIHGERTDWLPRVRCIIDHGETKPFEPFDRFAQFDATRGRALGSLLDEFASARADSLMRLRGLNLSAQDLDRRGRHPALGPVTLRQLLATWVAHDLDHVMQIARVLAYRHREDVGPWRAYLRVISGHQG